MLRLVFYHDHLKKRVCPDLPATFAKVRFGDNHFQRAEHFGLISIENKGRSNGRVIELAQQAANLFFGPFDVHSHRYS